MDMQVNSISNSEYKQSFYGGIGVFDTDAQQMILKNCSAEQIEKLKDIFVKQKNDRLFCFIYLSKNKNRLEARIMCTHFIKNFKEYYKQIPIFESTFGFIKRMSKRMDKYKDRLRAAGANI